MREHFEVLANGLDVSISADPFTAIVSRMQSWLLKDAQVTSGLDAPTPTKFRKVQLTRNEAVMLILGLRAIF